MGRGAAWQRQHLTPLMHAGLEIREGLTSTLADLQSSCALKFAAHCRAAKIEPDGTRSGSQLWAKFGDMKREVTSILVPTWNRLFPGGTLPSGLQRADAEKRFGADLWKQDRAKKLKEREKGEDDKAKKHVHARVFVETDEIAGAWGIVLAKEAKKTEALAPRG